MRSASLLSLLSVAGFLACSTSSNRFASNDAGSDATSVTGATTTKKDGGTTEETDSGKKPKDSGAPPVTACAPGDVSSFTPTWKAPAVLHAGACAPTQITTLIDCFFNASASQTTCDAFQKAAANQSCIKCAATADSAPALGPMVVSADSLVTLNIAGCIARTANQMTATGCGAKVQALGQCTDEACNANCPVPDGDDQALQDRNQCQTDAESSACQSFATDAQCADALLQGAAAPCNAGSTFEDLASALTTLFCGT